MSLSVIVTSYGSRPLLEQCLASLVRQPMADEIVVADCSPRDPSEAVHALFPDVRVLHFTGKRTVPQLRWEAVRHTRGEVVAATEGRCVPSSTWCADLVRAHAQHGAVPAVGGPVGLKPGASLFDWGLYFAEFGLFVPPIEEGDVAQLSGANLSYKRAALDGCRDLLDNGEWEASLHERWLREGRHLRMSSAAIVFHNGMRVPDAFLMRFHYGRSYASGRFRMAPRFRRLVYSAGTPLLPALLTWRSGRMARRQSRAWEFWRALPWVLALNVAWSAGELVGYVMGPSPRPHIY